MMAHKQLFHQRWALVRARRSGSLGSQELEIRDSRLRASRLFVCCQGLYKMTDATPEQAIFDLSTFLTSRRAGFKLSTAFVANIKNVLEAFVKLSGLTALKQFLVWARTSLSRRCAMKRRTPRVPS